MRKSFIYSNIYKALIISVLFICFSLNLNAQISGTVFTDGNNNGIKDATDVGFPNATVNAYLTGNTLVTTTTSANDGTYTLAGLSAGVKYRIEFVPFSGFTDGAVGTGSASSVQFATTGATNINFGIFLPGKCGTDTDQRMIGTCGLFNNPSVDYTVASWRYQTDFYAQTKWGANNYPAIQPHQEDLKASEVGVPWAMARIPNTNYVVMVPVSSPATSVFGTGGSAGTTALYLANYSGTNAAYSDYKTLVQLSSLGFSLTAENPIGAVQPRFGEFGLGGVAVSPDGKYIYAANLGKGNILRLDISGVNYSSLPITAPTLANVSEISFPTSIAGFTSGTDGYFRATAMKQHGGDIYIAGTFDGSLRANNSAVRVVVFKLNVNTNAVTEVFNYDPTTFRVGNLGIVTLDQTRWTAGPDTERPDFYKNTQPVVSGFDFDNYGAITLGITSRAVYNLNTNNEMGYVVSTWRNADGTFTLENNGARGSLSTANSGTTMHDVYGSGPGGNVFYDQSIGHPYLFNGGLLNITSKSVMAMGVTDPMMIQSFGVRYDQQKDGGIIGGIGIGGGKIYALVGVDAVCTVKDPIEIGNYVWNDANSNGIMDGDELPISGVSVELVNNSGVVIATAVTDANGNYIFSSDPNRTSTASHIYNLTQLTPQTSFKVRIPNTSGSSQQSPLANLYLTLSNQGTSDVADNDGTLNGTASEIAIITGSEGQNNHTLDFGFKSTPSCSLTATATATNVSCNAGTDGTATATASGNAGAVTYLWSNAATAASITGLTAGVYTVTVTESPACTATASVTITEPSDLTLACAKTDVTTTGGNNGTATVTATGGTSPYTYLWSNGATTVSIAGLTAGTYTVTVTDAKGCSNVCSSIIVEPGCNLSATATGTNVSCNGGANGTATVTPSGNLGAVTYLWSNAATSASITGLSAGTYTVTVTESASCTATASYTVTAPTALSLTCSKIDVTTISGTNGEASVTATGGTSPYTYAWSNGATSATISSLSAGTYTVTVSDANACTSICSSTVNEPGCTAPTLGTNTPSAGTCTGTTPNDDATVTFTSVTNATVADRVIGSSYGASPAYGDATNANASTGNLQFTGLKHNTTYTFRFWNGSASCYTDITITTPSKTCTLPCPTNICTPIKVTKIN